MAIDPAWIAFVGTIFGGAGLKAVETWLGKNRVRIDDATRIRDELRLEITAQREEIKQLESDVDKWREEYYNLRDKYMALQTELTLTLQKIKDEADAAAAHTEILRNKPPVTPAIDTPGKT